MGHRLSKIYTRTGDGGTTGLADGSRVAKDSQRISTLGDIDELNSLIGAILIQDISSDMRECLVDVQHALFDIGGELAIRVPSVSEDYVAKIEHRWTPLTKRCRHSRSSFYRVVGPPPSPVTLRVPCVGVPSAHW